MTSTSTYPSMDIRFLGFDAPLLHNLHHMLDSSADADAAGKSATTAYVLDAKAMAATPTDVKESSTSYVFVIDMPELKSGDTRVQVEAGNMLLISGERRREEEEGACRYLRMERRVGKFMRKFVLPENANLDKITAVCSDGVLMVTVEKLPTAGAQEAQDDRGQDRLRVPMNAYESFWKFK